MTDFGSRFRKARESLGVPLEKIAAETRISTRFLLAIENEEFQLLPGGIFNRGFIRTYAKRVGLDPEEAVSDYERISSTAQQPIDSTRHVQATGTQSQNALYFVAIGVLVLLIVVFYFVNRNPSPEAVTEDVPAAPAEKVVEPTPDPPVAVPIVEPPAPPIAEATTPNPTTSPLMLELEASNVTWIRLSADGIVVDDVILQPGNTRRYTANNTMDITIGNAAGVTIKVNGRDIGALGGEGKTRKFSITPDNAATIRG